MCNLTVAKTDKFGSVVDSKRKCVQKTSAVPSRAVSGHDGCMHEYHLVVFFFLGGGGRSVTEILEGLIWRRRSGWTDGRKRVPRNVTQTFIKHFQVSQDEELHCSSCMYTCRKCKLEVRAQRLCAFYPFGLPPVHSPEALERLRLLPLF